MEYWIFKTFKTIRFFGRDLWIRYSTLEDVAEEQITPADSINYFYNSIKPRKEHKRKEKSLTCDSAALVIIYF